MEDTSTSESSLRRVCSLQKEGDSSAVGGLCVADSEGTPHRILVHLTDALPVFSRVDVFLLNFENSLPGRRVCLLKNGEELFEGLRFRQFVITYPRESA